MAAAQPGVDVSCGLLAVADGDRDRAFPKAPCRRRQNAGWPVIIEASTFTTPLSNSMPWTLSSSDRSTSWPKASTMSVSASMVSNSPVGCGKPLSSSAIFSTVNVVSSTRLMVLSHDHDALVEGLLQLEVVCGHLLAGASIHDQCFLAPSRAGGARPRQARYCRRRRSPRRPRLLAGFHAAQDTDGIEDARGVARRNFSALGRVRADREEGRIETPSRMLFSMSSTRVLSFNVMPRSGCAHLGIEDIARQSILRNAEGASSRRWWPGPWMVTVYWARAR